MKIATNNNPRFFTSDAGALVRYADCETVRPLFACHRPIITTGAELRASLRAGPVTWPGCYALAYIATDGSTVCPDCVRTELYQCIYSLRNDIHDGWCIAGIMSETETDSACTCDHCGREVWPGADGATPPL